MSKRRDEFADQDKAAIFVRDRATCCYSGKSLWLLDYGAAPTSVDWVDHIVPASKGGLAEPDNGLCASWVFNKLKRDLGGTMPLFIAGYPTVDFFTFYETVPDSIAAQLHRFAALHISDWYFNRAVYHVQVAAAQKDLRRADGKEFTRGLEYWCKAAQKYLARWGKLVGRERPLDFASRQLLPTNPSVDHEILLPLLNVPELGEVIRIASELAPFAAASWQAFVDLSLIENRAAALDLLARVEADSHVVPRVQRAVRHNVAVLFQ